MVTSVNEGGKPVSRRKMQGSKDDRDNGAFFCGSGIFKIGD